jgi:hypothetical protein
VFFLGLKRGSASTDPAADSIAPPNTSAQAVTSDTTSADADAGKVAHLEDH